MEQTRITNKANSKANSLLPIKSALLKLGSQFKL